MYSQRTFTQETSSSYQNGRRFSRTSDRSKSNSRSRSKNSTNAPMATFYVKNIKYQDEKSVQKYRSQIIRKNHVSTNSKPNHETLKQKRMKYINNESTTQTKASTDKQTYKRQLFKYQQCCRKQQIQLQCLKNEKRQLQLTNKKLKNNINQLQRVNQELIQKLQNQSRQKNQQIQNSEAKIKQLQIQSSLLYKKVQELEASLQNTRKQQSSLTFTSTCKFDPNNALNSDDIYKHQSKLQSELYNTRQQVQKMHINHNFELRKAYKQLEKYKQIKQKQYMQLKQKFATLLVRFKDVSKKATSLEIKNLLVQGKKQALPLSLSCSQVTESFCLSSDEQIV